MGQGNLGGVKTRSTGDKAANMVGMVMGRQNQSDVFERPLEFFDNEMADASPADAGQIDNE